MDTVFALANDFPRARSKCSGLEYLNLFINPGSAIQRSKFLEVEFRTCTNQNAPEVHSQNAEMKFAESQRKRNLRKSWAK